MRAAKKPRPADVSRAQGYIDRVRALIEQQKELGGDISDVCTEAKENAGLDPTVIRFVARELLMDAAKRAERNDKREQYLHAVGLAVKAVRSGEVSARQAAKIYNIGKTSIYNALSVREVSAPVEMTADDLGRIELPNCGAVGAFDACDYPHCDCHAAEESEPIREMVADDLGDPLLITNPFRAKVKAIAASVKTTGVLAVPPCDGTGTECGPLPAPAVTDDLTPPAFRRERATA